MTFDTTDLFVVGLAFDITGAIALARGLLISPVAIGKVEGTYFGGNVLASVDRCGSRVDGFFGVGFLVAGFVFQAAGYAVQLGDGNGNVGGAGGDRVLAALLVGLVALALGGGFYLLAHRPFLKRTLRRMELERDGTVRSDDGAPPGEWSPYKVVQLSAFAQAAGWDKNPPDEHDADYIERVFRVELPPKARRPENDM